MRGYLLAASHPGRLGLLTDAGLLMFNRGGVAVTLGVGPDVGWFLPTDLNGRVCHPPMRRAFGTVGTAIQPGRLMVRGSHFSIPAEL